MTSRRWLLATSATAGVGLWVAVAAYALNQQTSSSPLAKNIVLQLRHNDQVQQALGRHVQPGYWFIGMINQHKGTAWLNFTLYGDQDSGKVRVVARRTGKDWRLDELTLIPHQSSISMDLNKDFIEHTQ